jgi:hypothetical protein
LEYLILLRFYHILLKGFIPNLVFYCLALGFSLFALIDSLFIEDLFSYNTYGRSVEALILVFLSMTWFVKIASEDDNSSKSNNGLKYITGGLLIYFSGSVVLFALRESISHLELSFRINVWTIHTLLAVLMYLLITLGLWKTK